MRFGAGWVSAGLVSMVALAVAVAVATPMAKAQDKAQDMAPAEGPSQAGTRGDGVAAPPVAAPAQPANQAEAPPQPATPLAAAIVDEAKRRADAQRPGPERDWLTRLAAFYGERLGEPLWLETTATGKFALGSKAGTASEEIGRADDWGLDQSKFEPPGALGAEADDAALARAEVQLSAAIARYAAHARGHRVDPSQLSKWLDQKPRAFDAGVVVRGVAAAADPAGALRALHPRHPQFERLRQAWLKARGVKPAEAAAAAPPVVIPATGPALRIGQTHADIALVRLRLGIASPAGIDTLYDDDLGRAVRKVMREQGRPNSSLLDQGNRAALNRAGKSTAATPPAAAASKAQARKLLVNMERWRWLPDDLGALHVWNNLPEFETRVVKGGEIIHQERIVIGKPEMQTPVFSDAVRYVVFKPEWGVPPSIKVRDLLPKLQSGDDDVLDRRNMRIVVNGRPADPGNYDWDKIDIRKVPIVQYAGPDNPLGEMKFMFPNKHDVYMHDTPTKHLFNSATRAFSSGCIRVRNPKKFAELVFAQDKSWSPKQVSEALLNSEDNKRIDLERRIPVHMTYFTMRVDSDGRVLSFGDVYGHDKRILEALDGRPVELIAKDDPALKLEQQIEEAVRPAGQPARSTAASRGAGYLPPYSGGGGNRGGYSSYPPVYKKSNGGGFLGGIFGFQ